MSYRIAPHPRRPQAPHVLPPDGAGDRSGPDGSRGADDTGRTGRTGSTRRSDRANTVVDMRAIHRLAQGELSDDSSIVSTQQDSSDESMKGGDLTLPASPRRYPSERSDADDFVIVEDESPRASEPIGAADSTTTRGARRDTSQAASQPVTQTTTPAAALAAPAGSSDAQDAYAILEPLLSEETKTLLQEYREKRDRHAADTNFGAPRQMLWTAAASQPIFVGALGIPSMIGKAVGIPQLLLLGGPLIAYGALPLVLNMYSGFARSPSAEEYNRQMKLLGRAVRDWVGGKPPTFGENGERTDAWSKFDMSKLSKSYLGKSLTDDWPFLLLILSYVVKAVTPTLADGHQFGNHTPADHHPDGPYHPTFYDRKTTLGPVRDALLQLAAGSAAVTSVNYIGQAIRHHAHPALYLRRPSADVLDTEIRLLQAMRADLLVAENRLLRALLDHAATDDSDSEVSSDTASADAPTTPFATPDAIHAQIPPLDAKLTADKALRTFMDTKLGADYRALFGAKAANTAATAGALTLLLGAVVYANMQTARLVQQEHTLEHQLMADMVGPAVLGAAILIRNEAINLVRIGMLAPVLGLGDRLAAWWSGPAGNDADPADETGGGDDGYSTADEGDEDGYV